MAERTRKSGVSKAVRERIRKIRAKAAVIRRKRILLRKEVEAMVKRVGTKRARS